MHDGAQVRGRVWLAVQQSCRVKLRCSKLKALWREHFPAQTQVGQLTHSRCMKSFGFFSLLLPAPGLCCMLRPPLKAWEFTFSRVLAFSY